MAQLEHGARSGGNDWNLSRFRPFRADGGNRRDTCPGACTRLGRETSLCGGSSESLGAATSDHVYPNSQALLAAIIESSFDAIVSKDLNSIITSWNPAAERLFGYSQDEALGRSVLMLIPDSRQAEEAQIIERIRRGERVESFETVRQRKDGTMVTVSLTISPVRNGGGVIVGASKIARDITATKENERRIRMLMREVNHRVKNQFAVILSMVRETGKRTLDARQFETVLRDRIMALSRSHDLLVSSEWKGASLFDLVQEHLRPFGHADQVSLSGPLLMLQPNAVQHLGMAFHELGANSSRYGALGYTDGRVLVNWNVAHTADVPMLRLVWEETFPHGAAAAEDERPGFGSIILERVAPQSLSGTSTFERSPGNVRWSLTAPISIATVATEVA